MDIKTERRHYLNVPMVARYLRLHPLTWRKRIGLRAGVLGCQHEGDCGPGFLRVNTKAGCGELTRSQGPRLGTLVDVLFFIKGGGYKLVWWQQLFIYYLLRWRVQCTHYTPVAEEQTYSVI